MATENERVCRKMLQGLLDVYDSQRLFVAFFIIAVSGRDGGLDRILVFVLAVSALFLTPALFLFHPGFIVDAAKKGSIGRA